MLLLLPYSLLGLANFFHRRHDATVRRARRTSENSVWAKFGEAPCPDGALSSRRDPHIGERMILADMGIGSHEALGHRSGPKRRAGAARLGPVPGRRMRGYCAPPRPRPPRPRLSRRP